MTDSTAITFPLRPTEPVLAVAHPSGVACCSLKCARGEWATIADFVVDAVIAVTEGFPLVKRITAGSEQSAFIFLVGQVVKTARSGHKDCTLENEVIGAYLKKHNCVQRKTLLPMGTSPVAQTEMLPTGPTEDSSRG